MAKQTGIIKLKVTIGIALATAGGTIITAPISIPALLITITTYNNCCRNCCYCCESSYF